MTIGQKILRFLDRDGEKLRREMRRSMACIEAHTEDLHRTVILDGAELRRKIAAHLKRQTDPEATMPL